MPTKDEPDIAQLADSYQILGDLAGRDDARVTLATRKSDGLPVLITVHREPEGDQGNALNHLASDANQIAGARHPGIVPVLESRWLDHSLAIITERPGDPTLEERLSRRQEEFPFPRIATLLREVNAILQWAREQRVVHRAVRLDSVFVEEGSDRVRVMFTVAPLPAHGIPDAQDDARTIAWLARAMMTRSVADPERDALPLAELRPGLPSRVVQDTEALLGRAESVEPVDVRAYISSIAMAEELRRGEDECTRVKREMSEEQQAAREALAAERKAHEEDLAEQARKFEKEREDILKEIAREREMMARALADEREEAERQLRRERERFEKEMQRQRAQLAKEQAKHAREREAFEGERASGREQIAAKLAAIRAQAELYDRTAELPAAVTDPLPEPPPFVTETGTEEGGIAAGGPEPYDEIVDEPVEVETREITPLMEEGTGPRRAAPAWSARPLGGRGLRRLGLAGALLLVIAVAALAFSRRGRDRGMQAADAQRASDVRVVDSFAGFAAPVLPVDSLANLPIGETASASTVPTPRARRVVREPRPETVSTPVDTLAPLVAPPAASPAPVLDSAPIPMPPLPFTRTDSAARTDTSMRRDTTVRRDTLARRDTLLPVRIDTSVRQGGFHDLERPR